MNNVSLTGRFCDEPTMKIAEKNGKEMKIANFTLAVQRKYGNGADFVRCVGFSKTAEVIEKYFHKGMKADVVGSITTGSYIDKDGKKVYTTTVSISSIEFGESKSSAQSHSGSPQASPEPTPDVDSDGFIKVPDDVSDEGLPFNL